MPNCPHPFTVSEGGENIQQCFLFFFFSFPSAQPGHLIRMPRGLVDAFQACPFEENLHIQDVLHLKWPREASERRTGAGKYRMAVEVLEEPCIKIPRRSQK